MPGALHSSSHNSFLSDAEGRRQVLLVVFLLPPLSTRPLDSLHLQSPTLVPRRSQTWTSVLRTPAFQFFQLQAELWGFSFLKSKFIDLELCYKTFKAPIT